jgi:hypothetical protein
MHFLVFKCLAKKYSRNSRRQTDSSPYPATRKIIQILNYKIVKKTYQTCACSNAVSASAAYINDGPPPM